MSVTSSFIKKALPADMAEHNAAVKRQLSASANQLDTLSHTLNQLLALEYVLFEHMHALGPDHERQEEQEHSVCADFHLKVASRTLSMQRYREVTGELLHE